MKARAAKRPNPKTNQPPALGKKKKKRATGRELREQMNALAPIKLKTGKGKGKRRWWTDEERALIMSVYLTNKQTHPDGAAAKTSRECGVPVETVYCWAKGHRHPEALQLHKEKAGELARAAAELAWLMAAIIPEKAYDAPLNHLVTAFGILVEKTRLLQGLSTNIGGTEVHVESASASRIAEVVSGTPEDERTVVVRFLQRLREPVSTLPPGPVGGEVPDAEEDRPPLPLPPFLGGSLPGD
jgi:hypothetical protein